MHLVSLLRRGEIQKNARGIDFHTAQMPLLGFVAEHNGCTQKEAADELHVSPASIAVSVKRMERAGLLCRTQDRENLRCNRLVATEKGSALARQTRRMFDALDRRMFDGFSEEDLACFCAFLDRILSNLTGARLDDDAVRAQLFKNAPHCPLSREERHD